jgi:hypothetical protein
MSDKVYQQKDDYIAETDAGFNSWLLTSQHESVTIRANMA